MAKYYTTTLNSGLKFIDKYVNTTGNWTKCENNTFGEYKLTTETVNNVNVFSLKKGDKSIQVSELPINLRVNMVLDSNNLRTFNLEEKALNDNITVANATLGFDPKYFVYDTSNNCYTIDSEAIILDHDVSACTGIIAVSVFEENEEGGIDTTKPSDFIKASVDTAKRQLNIGVSNITTSIINNAITNITSSNDFITVERRTDDPHTFNISFDNTKVHSYTATSGYYINVSTKTEGVNDNFTISLNANVNTGSEYTVRENNLDTFIAVSNKSNEVALPSTINVSDSGVRLLNNNGNLDVHVGNGKKINFYIDGSIVLSIEGAPAIVEGE